MPYNIALLFKVLCASQKILDLGPHQYPICDLRRCTVNASEVPLCRLFYMEVLKYVSYVIFPYEFKI